MAVIPVSVRRFVPGHAADVLALARSLGDWFNDEGLRQMETDLRNHAGHVALLGSRLVGFETWNPVDGRVANLSWMGVAKDVQRAGIGRTLVEAIVPDLRSAGFRFLEVSTVADSVDYRPYERTRAFYRAIGFADERVDRGFFQDPDGPYDRLLLRLDLARPNPGRSPEA